MGELAPASSPPSLMKKSGFNKKPGFKRKSGLPKSSGLEKKKYKRNALKQKKRKETNQSPRQKEIAKLDRAFSMYIRMKHADQEGYCRCFTCSKKGFWKNDIIQCGHYKSRLNMATRWLSINAHPQCSVCNVFLNGNIPNYEKKLVETYGEEILQEIEQRASEVKKLSVEELRTLRISIERELRKLRKEKGL